MLKRISPLFKALTRVFPKAAADRKPAADDAETPAAKPSGADWALASASSIAFSLTFFAGGLALLFGLIPTSIASVAPSVDLAVLVLMVPLCALTLMIIAEALRAAMSGVPRVQPPRLAAALSEWRPGRGEG